MSERPMAAVRRVDVSAHHGSAPAARSTSEDMLLHAYRRATDHLEELPCACGGTVQADPERPAPGVAAHQYTSRHKGWRSAMGLDW